jgi:hypothetical protein
MLTDFSWIRMPPICRHDGCYPYPSRLSDSRLRSSVRHRDLASKPVVGMTQELGELKRASAVLDSDMIGGPEAV